MNSQHNGWVSPHNNAARAVATCIINDCGMGRCNGVATTLLYAVVSDTRLTCDMEGVLHTHFAFRKKMQCNIFYSFFFPSLYRKNHAEGW